MTEKIIAPSVQDGTQGATSSRGKVIKIGRIQGKVLGLFQLNPKRRYSVAELSVLLFLSDPRGHIAALRNKGFPIADEWCVSPYGNRFKRYYYNPADNESTGDYLSTIKNNDNE